MKKHPINKKRIIGVIAVGVACCFVIVVGQYKSNANRITIYDKNNNELAEVKLIDGEFRFECTDDSLAYSQVVMNEVTKILSDGELSDAEINKKIAGENTKIFTYCDANICKQMQTVLQEELDNKLKSAAVFTDTTGRVVACCSGFDDVNHVVERRYVASTIKPLSIYGPAMEQNIIHWSSLYEDAPVMQIKNKNGKLIDWPQSSCYTGKMKTIQDGISKSSNATAVRVLKELDMENEIDFLTDKMGFQLEAERELLERDGAESIWSHIALGYLSHGESILEMTGRYQVFANGGMYQCPYTVSKIEMNDETIYQHSDKSIQVFSTETAYIVNRLLKGVLDQGGTGENAYIEGMDVCGKTGTTEGNRDNWFIGITPDYICGIWYGREADMERENNIAPNIYKRVMQVYLEEEGKMFISPASVVEKMYCVHSGKIASDACTETQSGYYKIDCMPEVCNQCE